MQIGYKERLKALEEYMNEHALDLAMIMSPVNIYYFTGFFSEPHERFMALVIDRGAGRMFLFVPALDEQAAAQAASLCQIISVADTDDPFRLLRHHLSAKVQAFGLEKKTVNLQQYEKLTELYPQARFQDIEAHISTLRRKKSPEEIAIVRRAVELVERVLEEGLRRIVPGMTELELTAELEFQMKVLGAERPAFSTIVLSGERSALPHGRPGQAPIEPGQLLLIDLGVFVDGYCSDITRTFVIGEASREQKKIYETVREANQQAISAVAAGVPLGSIDRAARDYIEQAGFGSYFTHRVGHGLGLEVHEAPSVHAQNDMPIESGLLFTIEPGIYVPGIGGVRIEDDIYIRDHGQAEVLTTYPKELRELC